MFIRTRGRLRRRPQFNVTVWRSLEDQSFRFTIFAANGERVCQSEGYVRHVDAWTMAMDLSAGRWPVNGH